MELSAILSNPRQLRRLLIEHGSAKALARHLGIWPIRINHAVIRLKIDYPRHPFTPHKLTARQVAEVRRMYAEGYSARDLARRFNIHRSSVEATIADIRRSRSDARRVQHNSMHTPEGRERLHLIHEATRLLTVDGLSRNAIAKRLGVAHPQVTIFLRTPYSAALRLYVFGPGTCGSAGKLDHARAMARQGCDVGLIARTLALEVEQVQRWIQEGTTR